MMAEELDKFILENFGGVLKDNPWEKEPEFTVFRHADNRKWFALRFYAMREQLLKLKSDDPLLLSHGEGERVEMINVKIDPEMISDVIREPGFLPAYHMSRRHWITVILDPRVEVARMKGLIEMSYGLTGKKYREKNGASR